ncbi:MAG: hypothetical protein WC712_00680 [Candidatus Brocadiia bacterium]
MRTAIMATVVVVLIEYSVWLHFEFTLFSLPQTRAEAQARQELWVFCDNLAPVAKRIEALDSFLGWYVPTHPQIDGPDRYAYWLSYIGQETTQPEEIRNAALGVVKRFWPELLPDAPGEGTRDR